MFVESLWSHLTLLAVSSVSLSTAVYVVMTLFKIVLELSSEMVMTLTAGLKRGPSGWLTTLTWMVYVLLSVETTEE